MTLSCRCSHQLSFILLYLTCNMILCAAYIHLTLLISNPFSAELEGKTKAIFIADSQSVVPGSFPFLKSITSCTQTFFFVLLSGTVKLISCIFCTSRKLWQMASSRHPAVHQTGLIVISWLESRTFLLNTVYRAYWAGTYCWDLHFRFDFFQDCLLINVKVLPWKMKLHQI